MDAFSISEFCRRNNLSRSKLYDEWKAGKGPRVMRVGSRVLISREAAADWRRNLEDDAARESR